MHFFFLFSGFFCDLCLIFHRVFWGMRCLWNAAGRWVYTNAQRRKRFYFPHRHAVHLKESYGAAARCRDIFCVAVQLVLHIRARFQHDGSGSLDPAIPPRAAVPVRVHLERGRPFLFRKQVSQPLSLGHRRIARVFFQGCFSKKKVVGVFQRRCGYFLVRAPS